MKHRISYQLNIALDLDSKIINRLNLSTRYDKEKYNIQKVYTRTVVTLQGIISSDAKTLYKTSDPEKLAAITNRFSSSII